MDDPKIINFSGEAGPSANIDLSIPLPGAHSGRRIIEITDIPDEAWSTEAKGAGTSWVEELGIEFEAETHVIENPEILIDRFYNGVRTASSAKTIIGRQSDLSKEDFDLMLGAMQHATKADAVETRRERGHLNEWRGNIDVKKLELPSPGRVSTDARSVSASRINTPVEKSALASKQTAAAEAVNTAFQSSLSQIDSGLVQIPTTKWGGALTMVPIDLNEPAQPRLFIIQVYGISSFLGDYGLGRTVKTITLAPNEEYKYSSSNWRSRTETKSLSSSIIDSYDESSSERFADSVLAETTDASTQEKSTNWYAEGEAKGSIGIASASASAGGGGESTASTEEFARSVDESVAEHANEASSHRENAVTSSSESTEESGSETLIERTIKNINVERTLNFVFRELNYTYYTKTHLKDIRIAFSNGQAGSWRETPLSGMAQFIDELIADEKTAKSTLNWILEYVSTVFDIDDTPQTTLERVDMDPCGHEIKSIRDARPNDDCTWDLPPRNMHFFYRFKRGDKSRRYAIGQEQEEQPVAGVLLRNREVVLRSDSVCIEALLGVNGALDTYSKDLQLESIRSQKLANDRDALALEIIRTEDVQKAQLYRDLFLDDSTDEEEA